MEERSTTFGPDQLWSQSDGLIKSYGMSDLDPKGVNINSLRLHRLPYLSRAFLHQSFVVPRLLGLVLLPDALNLSTMLLDVDGPDFSLWRTQRRRHYFFE